MEPARAHSDALTTAQAAAVLARGNVLVMAGAGTGKTKTLVARCLDCLERERVSLDELLIVTFTEAAAAEMRLRLRRELERKLAAAPGDEHWPRQLALFDAAHIGTLHGFCLKLVREHFYEAGLDPQLTLLDEGEARQLAAETLEEQFQSHYAGEDPFSRAVQELIQNHGNGRDDTIRALVLRLHNYSQTRADAVGWIAGQRQSFSANAPADWLAWLLTAIKEWRDHWRPFLESPKIAGDKVKGLADTLDRLSGAFTREQPDDVLESPQRARGVSPQDPFTREQAAEVLEQVLAADADWPKRGSPRKLLETFFDEAAFLSSLAAFKNGVDPLLEDWNWLRGPMETLLHLTREFADIFSDRKRAAGLLDFHDLEQSALQLLWDPTTHQPSAIATFWRQSLRFIFVDEYQDINAAQDRILTALAREGADANRFLVGDVKQSIYRFRLADPKIFREYSRQWQGGNGQTIALSENFRSREGILNFVNSFFRLVMREELGGVNYDDEAALKCGLPPVNNQPAEPRTELLLRLKVKPEETPGVEENGEIAALDESAKEARLIARHLKALVTKKHQIPAGNLLDSRELKFSDMAVLLRSPKGKEDIFTREFAREGVPLSIARRGFYDSPEILDLLSLLRLLDNPLQDTPCLAVLRSPLVGLSLDELAEIRLKLKQGYFWTALAHSQQPASGIGPELRAKVERFLNRFSQWRKLARQVSLSQCLEDILAQTAYDDWLKTRPRGQARAANLDLFLRLTRQFDQYQRQGLFRFLKFVEAQQEIEAEPEVPAEQPDNCVRLMSIHQSKGLEFPVVVVAELDKKFNEKDLHGDIVLDDKFGLCPRIKPPASGRRYPSLPHWLAQKYQKRELRGEELRLLYVAMTRARDLLVLSSSVTEQRWETLWRQPAPVTLESIATVARCSDWLGMWFAHHADGLDSGATEGRTLDLSWRLVPEAELIDLPAESSHQSPPEKANNVLWCVSPTELTPPQSDLLKPATAENSDQRPTEAANNVLWRVSPTELTPPRQFDLFEAANVENSDQRPPKTASNVPWCVSPTELTPSHQPNLLAAATMEKLRDVLGWEYPHTAATTRSAKASVTELRRAAEAADEEAEKLFVSPMFTTVKRPTNQSAIKGRSKLTAAATGAAHHKFLQHVSLLHTEDLAAEADRLTREHFLTPEERAALDLKALANFWDSSPGQSILAQPPDAILRELPFTARFSPAELSTITNGSFANMNGEEFIVVQGVADLVVLLPKEIWLVDFKTDKVRAEELPAKTKTYEPQLQLYALALKKIFARSVTKCALHFLSAQETVWIALEKR
jgi:ATP-dependent helicase/nuclease subunit A